ncbi:hypothetical protein GCM10010330_22450 [Streptomyces tendae]|nr:hypothetical protein GCM10010330_22450 [Streptomyces tendae]
MPTGAPDHRLGPRGAALTAGYIIRTVNMRVLGTVAKLTDMYRSAPARTCPPGV